MKKAILIFTLLIPVFVTAQIGTIYPGGEGRYNVMSYSLDDDVAHLKIVTKIPSNAICNIYIQGVDVAGGYPIDFHLGLLGAGYGTVSTSGYTPAEIYLEEVVDDNGNYIAIYLANVMFSWPRFEITAFAIGGNASPDWFQDWLVYPDGPVGDLVRLEAANRFESIYTNSLSSSDIWTQTMIASTRMVTKDLEVNGGAILSKYGSFQTKPFGMYHSRHNNHFSQNAYYRDGVWKAYSAGGEYSTAALVKTATAEGVAFQVDVASNISLPNQILTFSKLFSITNGGVVGIGTTTALTSSDPYKLYVEGGIRTRKVKVDVVAWPDYVFDATYNLRSLVSLEQFIQTNKHLPDVPSAKEVEEGGLDVGAMQTVLLKKIEELTLYLLKQQEQIDELNTKVKEVKSN